jgi:hypothetical protein
MQLRGEFYQNVVTTFREGGRAAPLRRGHPARITAALHRIAQLARRVVRTG